MITPYDGAGYSRGVIHHALFLSRLTPASHPDQAGAMLHEIDEKSR